MKPTSKTLSWAFVIILLAVGIFTGLGVILMHGIHLLILGMYFRAINDDKSISPVYPVSLLNEESVDTAGKFPTDTVYAAGKGTG